MTLALVPLPPDYLEGSQSYWRPYVVAIADRAKNNPAEMERMLYAGEAQAFLVWDDEGKKPQAFVGVQYLLGTSGRIGQIIWLMGENRREWVHLFTDLETYLREQQHCVAMKAIARPGWSKVLKASGYRLTHQVMEKPL